MAASTSDNVYTQIGVNPMINATANKTHLGGSNPAASVIRAMEEANEYYVHMDELMDRSGEFVAGLLGVEAAYITSGCAAATTLSAAACIAGGDKERIGRLPDTTGMKTEFVIFRKQRFFYDRHYEAPGGKLVWIGDENGCSSAELEEAIGSDTAAVCYLIKGGTDLLEAVPSIEETRRMANEAGVPVILDAASQNYPLEYFRSTAQSADLACFAGKYFGAPSQTGFACGRKDLVEAVSRQGFVAAQTGDRPRGIGRPMKVDRQAVIGLVTAMREWFEMDHNLRFEGYVAMAGVIQERLQGLPSVSAAVRHADSRTGPSLEVNFDPGVVGKTGEQAMSELGEGSPSVFVGGDKDRKLTLSFHTMHPGQERVVADRLRAVLAS